MPREGVRARQVRAGAQSVRSRAACWLRGCKSSLFLSRALSLSLHRTRHTSPHTPLSLSLSSPSSSISSRRFYPSRAPPRARRGSRTVPPNRNELSTRERERKEKRGFPVYSPPAVLVFATNEFARHDAAQRNDNRGRSLVTRGGRDARC